MPATPASSVVEAVEQPDVLRLIGDREYPQWVLTQSAALQDWLPRSGFKADAGKWLVLPGASGPRTAAAPRTVLVGTGNGVLDPPQWLWLAAGLADRLPPGDYALAADFGDARDELFATGWALGSYRFNRYRQSDGNAARLRRPRGVSASALAAAHAGTWLARDLINTPANDMGPAELEAASRQVAEEGGGSIEVISGAALGSSYPLVAAVGQGSPRAPRLIELRFRRPGAPRVTLVGKGVCFDTGGLDIKPAAGMLLMKKDMGGAACALGTARALRQLDLPVDLRVLIPAVENSVDGAAFRPGDVWRSRKGLTVEIGNTDAEGRLVLADGLALVDADEPDLLIDLATLTGAARVALGPELPALFCADDDLCCGLLAAGRAAGDPLWRLPLWAGYDDELSSKVADLGNVSASPFAGAILGALFLQRFVSRARNWVHLDLYAWNGKDRPGRPVGAEAQTLRALFTWIESRYAGG